MESDLIRVALQADEPSIRDLFERSGMVAIVESAPEVLVWHLPSDSDGLPAELRAALADPHGPGIVALTDDHPSRWFEEAMHLGVDDVLCLPQSSQSLGMAAAKARASRARRAAAMSVHSLPSTSRAGRDAHVFTVFSTKGGSGKTVISTNLAVCFARQGLRTLLVDLDLHSGDDALVLGLSPRWTVLDLVQSPGDLDAEKLAGFVTRHTSGVDLLPAPTRPDEEELVAIDRLEPLLEVARKSYDAVVIDTSSSFSPATLLAIDHTDTLILVG
ncbi:MAG: AAA family ATPase, partial [Gaiellales bacterium]